MAVALTRGADWSPTIAIIMILCNVVAIAFAKYTVNPKNTGPELPSSSMFGGFGLGGVIGITSFGHILGAGVILGLSNMGVI